MDGWKAMPLGPADLENRSRQRPAPEDRFPRPPDAKALASIASRIGTHLSYTVSVWLGNCDLGHVAVAIMKGGSARGEIKIPHPAEPIIKAHRDHLIPFVIERVMPTPQSLAVAFAKFDRLHHIQTRLFCLLAPALLVMAASHLERYTF